MENENGKQENQGENAEQNSSHKHIGEDRRNSRQQNSSQGRRKQINQP